MIKLALVGKGAWGKNYISTINSLSFCKLPKDYIRTFDYKELFPHKDIDGVIISSPTSTHFKIAKEFLEKGFNVLVEKPITANYEETQELFKIANDTREILEVGHIYLYNPAYLKIKKIISQLGDIKYISSQRMDYGPVRQDISSLWDWAPHDISMSIDLFGELPKSVSAYGANFLQPNTPFYDMCYIRLEFSNNKLVFINVGWLSPLKKREMVIVGEDKAIIFDDAASKKITYLENLKGDRRIKYPSFSKKSPLELEISNFVRLIKKDKSRKNSEMGLNVVKVISACEKSIRQNGKSVYID